MSLVDLDTGEIVDQLDEDAARLLTNRIRQCVAVAHTSIISAYKGRAWIAMGYASWEEYCGGEFGDERMPIPKADRSAVVALLRAEGLSLRAVGSALGISHVQAMRDAEQQVVRDVPPATVEAADELGPHDDPPQGAEVTDTSSQPGSVSVTERTTTSTTTTVTGIDGKKYPAQKEKPMPTAAQLDKVEQIRQYAALGMNASQIGVELGVSGSNISDIARKHGIVLPGSQAHRDQRIEYIRNEAARGASSRQMAPALGISEVYLREIARDNGIDIPADAIVRNTKRLDHTRIVAGTVEDTYGLGSMLDEVDWAQVDMTEAEGWLSSLSDAIRSLQTLKRNIEKELTNREQQ